MSDKNHDFTSLVCIYAQLLPEIREAGKKLGYAIAIHGTMARDLDLLAIPWVENASPPIDLVHAIRDAVGGYVIGDLEKSGKIDDSPTVQPHGRLSWNICWGGKPFIDLSVMPLHVPLPPGLQEIKLTVEEADVICQKLDDDDGQRHLGKDMNVADAAQLVKDRS